ncbi:MAG: hemolysin family protein [Candidatus Wallbacteria bacterium]
MGIFWIVITGIISIAMLAFFSGAEVAMISINKVRIKLLAEGGGGIENARIMNELLKDHEKVISAMLIGVNISIILGTTIMTFMLNNLVKESASVLIMTIIMPPLYLIFGELIPKRICRGNADMLALKYVRVIRFFYNKFYYIVSHFTFLLDLVKRLFKSKQSNNPTMTKEEIQYLIKMSESEGVIKKSEMRMIDSIFEFNNKLLNDVMTPRNDIVAVQSSATLEDVLAIGVKEGFSRMPVYDKNIDNVSGFVYILDLIQSIDLQGKTLKDFIRPIHFSPETKKISAMLHEMQKTKIHMSIVVDEYGQTAGLCTIEDIIEEIVGEIRDEYDVEEPEMIKINENAYLFNAMMDLSDVCKKLDLSIESSDFEELDLGDIKTIGGFVISLIGRIPKLKDEISYKNIKFIVEKIDKQRIKQVKAIKKAIPAVVNTEVTGA